MLLYSTNKAVSGNTGCGVYLHFTCAHLLFRFLNLFNLPKHLRTHVRNMLHGGTCTHVINYYEGDDRSNNFEIIESYFFFICFIRINMIIKPHINTACLHKTDVKHDG